MWEEMMSDDLILDDTSVLDLEISGAVGSFAVKPDDFHSSIPVRYIQTHVRFSLDGGHQQRLFENLVPVREIFEPKDLDFEDLMQRDIDDSRVSTSLIPYLLSLQSGENVKFFPPIVTVVIPVGPEKELLDYYPQVDEVIETEAKFNRHIARAGAAGNESFEFEQIEVNGKLKEFDNAKLRINTSKCKIVIVDGQHRAMALLALYRNLKGWPDKTFAFKDYYKRWSKDILRESLKEITLPIVVCTFPTLSDANTKTTVTQACRAIFLALNKNARPVSVARNILLDDYDLIAHFERSILEQIKNETVTSTSSVRLYNFELDADENKIALNSTVALSGVMHLYSLLERSLLSSDAPQGLNYPAKKYGKIKNIGDTCLRRLDGVNLLGDEGAKSTTRYAFTSEARRILRESFNRRYGKYIVRGYQQFYPFEAMANASIKLEVELRHKHEIQCHSMLFEGQGILRVFESYLELLEAELDEAYPDKNYPPELGAILDEFRATKNRLRSHQEQFFRKRTKQLLETIPETKIVDPVFRAIQEFYRTVVTTTAFQNALFITFFSTIEALNKDGRNGLIHGDAEDDKYFDEYLSALNRYFRPRTEQEVKRLLSVFSGNVTGTFGTSTMKVTDSAYTLRKIVIPNELKPDEWGKFRYILLEMWQSGDGRLNEIIHSYVQECRDDVLRAFFNRELKDYCEKNGIDLTEVDPKEKRKIENSSVTLFCDALTALIGIVPKEEKMRLAKSLSGRPIKSPVTEPVLSGT
jgi:hypothetical protein